MRTQREQTNMLITQLAKIPDNPTQVELPLFVSHIRAGLPSPADDFIDRHLDLNEFLIKKPSATFFAWAEGESLCDIGINDGDLLIIDRSVQRLQGDIVVAAIDGELTCKILDLNNMQLLAANPDFPPINITDKAELIIEGTVIHSIKQHRKRSF